jgi:hypothetical protein
MRLRALIFDAAAKTDGVGALAETLKWGQPSYLTPETKSGTTVRIDAAKDGSGRAAMYFHCQTDLVDRFRSLYPELRYEGNRAIVFEANDDIPAEPLRHCVAMALTYHLAKKRAKQTGGGDGAAKARLGDGDARGDGGRGAGWRGGRGRRDGDGGERRRVAVRR